MKNLLSAFVFTLLFCLNLNAYDCRCVDGVIIVTVYEWYAESEQDCCGPWTGYGTYNSYINGNWIGSGFSSSEDISGACC